VGLFAMFSRAGPRGPSETVTERESGTVDRRRRRPTGPAAGATRGRRTGPPGRSACDPCSRALLGRAVVLNKRSPYGGEPPFLPNAQVCRGVGSGRPIGKRRDSATEAGPRRPFRVRWPLGRPQRPPAAPAPRRAAMGRRTSPQAGRSTLSDPGGQGAGAARGSRSSLALAPRSVPTHPIRRGRGPSTSRTQDRRSRHRSTRTGPQRRRGPDGSPDRRTGRSCGSQGEHKSRSRPQPRRAGRISTTRASPRSTNEPAGMISRISSACRPKVSRNSRRCL
jgi:hypothetical protein